MRNKELINWIKLWKLKNQILPNCLYRKYGAQLGELPSCYLSYLGLKRLMYNGWWLEVMMFKSGFYYI